MRRQLFANPTAMNYLPKAIAPKMSANHFLVCPAALFQGMTQEQLLRQAYLYRLAFEQAQEAARPSLPERDLLGVWN